MKNSFLHLIHRTLVLVVFCSVVVLFATIGVLLCSTVALSATFGNVSRTGAYHSDGSYVWTYTCRITTGSTSPETLAMNVGVASNFPFEIKDVPASVTADALLPATVRFSVFVPKTYITEPVNPATHTITLSLIDNSAKTISTPIHIRGPLPGHPRLFVRKNELADIGQRFIHPDFDDVKRVYNDQKNFNTNGIVTSEKPDEKIRQKMEALALEYMLEPAQKVSSGKEAIAIAINYLSSYAKARTTKADNYEDNTNTYEALLGGAMVYDWCYALLAAEEKAVLYDYLKQVCMLGEYGLPGTGKVQYLAGHYGECAPSAYLAIGIATFDEDPSFFDFEYNEQVNNFAPSRNPMYKAGTHHQGAQYIHVRYTHELLQHFMLNKLGLSPYNADITNAAFRALYDIIPQKKDLDGMPEGDGHNHLEMGYSQLFYLSANLSRDPVMQTVSKQYLMETKHQSARLFVFHNPEIASKPLDSLCLSRFFPSPSGIMIARTKWDLEKTDYSSNAMVVIMNMKEYNAQNHTHLDAGHFGIYYKGHLALDAGIYQGKDAQNGWAKLNYINYLARTIAHNSLLVFDPNEPLPYGWDKKSVVKARDGGQFYFADHAWNTSMDMFTAGKSSTILAEEIAHGYRPEYSYMKGDVTSAYNTPKFIAVYPPKVEMVRRSFVFLNHNSDDIPGTLIVLDKVVSTNASFKKTWLLHTQNEPVIQGNQIIAINTNGGRNGQLLTTVVLPERDNQNIVKIGGQGKEYWADGNNWGSVTQEDAGRWRIELSPANNSRSDNFLNVIQAMDAGVAPTNPSVTTVYSDNKEYVVLQIKDRIVAEQLGLDRNEKPIAFRMGANDSTYKVLVTDLSEGVWTVSASGKINTYTVSDTSGTLYFEAHGGKFLITKK